MARRLASAPPAQAAEPYVIAQDPAAYAALQAPVPARAPATLARLEGIVVIGDTRRATFRPEAPS